MSDEPVTKTYQLNPAQQELLCDLTIPLEALEGARAAAVSMLLRTLALPGQWGYDRKRSCLARLDLPAPEK